MHFIGPYASVITIVTMKKDDTQLTVYLPAPQSKKYGLRLGEIATADRGTKRRDHAT